MIVLLRPCSVSCSLHTQLISCFYFFSQTVFEDIYIALCKCDGIESAYLLRRKIVKRIQAADPLTNFQQNHPDGITNPTLLSYGSVV